jgi:hypothetical protein
MPAQSLPVHEELNRDGGFIDNERPKGIGRPWSRYWLTFPKCMAAHRISFLSDLALPQPCLVALGRLFGL